MQFDENIPVGSVWEALRTTYVIAVVWNVTSEGQVFYSIFDIVNKDWDSPRFMGATEFMLQYRVYPKKS